jgi:hypothetical protein
MREDCKFFEQNHIIDYSLLIGIHYLDKATKPSPRPTEMKARIPEEREEEKALNTSVAKSDIIQENIIDPSFTEVTN